MIAGFVQTLRAVWDFWHMAANLDGAHAELERNLMRDKWGPPANGEGWPTFDENGRRVLEVDQAADDLEYAELGGEA